MSALTAPQPTPARAGLAALWRIALLIAATVSVNIVAGAFSGEKLSFLYKNELGLSAGAFATLTILIAVPDYLRPFFGTAADLYPFFGYHRRSYFLLAALLQSGGFFALSLLPHYSYAATAALVIIVLSGGILLMVIADALMVSAGNATGQVSRLQTIQQFMAPLLSIAFAAHLSGYVTQHWSYAHCFRAAAVAALAAVPLTFLIQERRVDATDATESAEARAARLEAKRVERQHTKAAVLHAVKSGSLWLVVLFVFYLIITPGTNTAQFYYEVDHLHFSKQFLGNLGAYGSAGSILGLIVYALLSPRLSPRLLVWGALVLDASIYLLLMALHDQKSAEVIGVVGGFTGILYSLLLLSLAARACPPGVEAAVYGLVIAAIGLGGTLGEKIGSTIYDHFGAAHGQIAQGWHTLLWFGFGFTLLAVVFVPFLPAWTKSRVPLRALAGQDVTESAV